jgi:hypothetical protein
VPLLPLLVGAGACIACEHDLHTTMCLQGSSRTVDSCREHSRQGRLSVGAALAVLSVSRLKLLLLLTRETAALLLGPSAAAGRPSSCCCSSLGGCVAARTPGSSQAGSAAMCGALGSRTRTPVLLAARGVLLPSAAAVTPS